MAASGRRERGTDRRCRFGGGAFPAYGPGPRALRLGGMTAPTLLERSVALLRPLCEQVWVSCRAGQTYARQNCVPDLLPASGPICGVHAALVRARAEGIPAVLALSCDLPLMHTGMLRRLVAAFAASPRQSLMTAFMAPNGWTESLAAIYGWRPPLFWKLLWPEGISRCGKPCP